MTRKTLWQVARICLVIFLASLPLLIESLTSPAWAQAPAPTPNPKAALVTDDQVNAIAKQMFCPVCESTPLDVCPTQACAQWRELIRTKLAEGWSEDQIKDYFVEQYGARVLGAPPAEGFNWLVYLVPPLAILAGAVVLFQALRAWRKPAQPTVASAVPEATSPAAPSKTDDEYRRRLEEELKKR